MKKYLVFILILTSVFFTFGCEKDVSILMTENLSEVVENYFCGVGSFCVSVSSGEREKEYVYNGEKTESVEFAIFSLYINSDADFFEAKISIDDEISNCKFELNKISGAYIYDLEKFISAESLIYVEYKGERVNCISKDFTVNYTKALNIGVNCFKDEMQSLVSKNEFNGECYLRILDNKDDEFQKVFWYFYVYAKNKTTYSCVIDCFSGEIIVKN